MEDRWIRRYDLAFALELSTAECEFLTGRHESAEERLSELVCRAATRVDRASVTCLKFELYTVQDRSDRAVEVCLEYLRQEEGVEWSAHPTDQDVRQEYDRLWRLIGSRSIEALVDLPVMNELSALATMDVLTRLWSAAFFTDENLAVLVATHMAIRSIQHGNTHASCCGYAWLAIMAGSFFRDYRSTRRFGQLSVDLVEQRALTVFAARVYNVFAAGVVPWTQHISAGPRYLQRALDFAAKTGDLAYSAYSYMHLSSHLLACGEPLDKTETAVSTGLSFAQKARFGLIVAQHTTHLQLIHTLRGLTREFGAFGDGSFDEGEFEQRLVKNPSLNYAACWSWIRKMQARVWANDPAAAVQAAAKARALLWTSRAVIEHAEYHFYGALARAASCDSPVADQRQQHFEALVAHHRQLEVWAENCPENFGSRAALVSAEIARIEGRDLDAMRHYEQAVRSAHANGFVHNEALANELAARFYLARGFEKIAYAYFQDARYCCLRWGATAKVRQLDELYPQLGEQEPVPGPTSTIEAAVEQLDLANIIKVSQALSSEIVLEKLIDTLMRTAIEYAGAERGLLILPRNVERRVEAEATTSGETIIMRLRESFVAQAEVPESIVHYVMRTQEYVILDDASAQNPFSADRYIRRHHTRSILCLPLINQAKVVGVLYLENKLTPRVFTPDRLAVLHLLASQAAISLENARLYADLTRENIDRRNAEEALRASEERWRKLFENSSAGIALIAPDSHYITANAAFQKILGYTEAELQKLTVLEVTYEEDRAVSEAILEEFAEGQGRDYRLEKRYRRKDGSVIWAEISTALIPGSGNTSAFCASVIVDITERKRAEEETKRIRRLEGEMRRASRAEMMGGLTASLAHELNQPLAAVQTTAQAARRFLARKTPALDRVKVAIDDVIQDDARAAEIIRNVRALFQRDEAQMSSVDLRQILYDVDRIVRADAASKNVTLQLNLPTTLSTVIGNRTQLIEALMNLVSNEIDSVCESDGGPRKVEMRASQPEAGRIHVSVRDSGKGIEPGIMPRLFDAFFTTKPKGMGMGLAIVRSIIENHGGHLRATRNPDRGATFEFDLPVKADVNERDLI
jgi:PAS domain S-box-containing protein